MISLACFIYKRHAGHAHLFTGSVNIACWMYVATKEIWIYGISPVERRFSQTFGGVSVTLAQQLFTFVLQIIALSCLVLARPVILSCFSLATETFCVSVTAVVFVATPVCPVFGPALTSQSTVASVHHVNEGRSSGAAFDGSCQLQQPSLCPLLSLIHI